MAGIILMHGGRHALSGAGLTNLLHVQTADVKTVYLGACVCAPALPVPAESPFMCGHGAAGVRPLVG